MSSTFRLPSLSHLSTPTLASAAAATVVALGAGWVLTDYWAWLRFGTGGTPPNFQGYVKITRFRVRRWLSGDDLRDASQLPSMGESYLRTPLPPREGRRPPIIARTLPQRQHPAPLDAAVRARLHALPATYVAQFPDLLTLDLSHTEGRSTDAIYARTDGAPRRHGATDRILGHEIAHVHPAENSLHVWLTKPDARKVVEAGWGERFPLSSLGMTDDGWTFVYAPRSMGEVDVVERIVKAGIAHLTGKSLE